MLIHINDNIIDIMTSNVNNIYNDFFVYSVLNTMNILLENKCRE